VWAEVLSPEQGLYSESYLREFCPDAGAEALTVREGMMKCYRRCSEFLHGSVQASSLLPERLVYDSGLSAEWLREAKTAVMTIHHALFVRYYGDLIETDRRRLDSCLETHLSHHRSIRLAIGLPVEEA
jgi:hypothetical protein